MMIKDDKPIFIIGCGGHAKVWFHAINQLGKDCAGFIGRKEIDPEVFQGKNVIDEEYFIKNFSCKNYNLINGIGALPDLKKRIFTSKKMRELGFYFPALVDISVISNGKYQVLEGSQILAGVIIQPDVMIGRDTIINTGAVLDHDVIIGNNCHISPNVTCNGGVKIEDNVFIGTNSIITQNVLITKNNFVKSQSLISSDL